ncbi:hypothetical protein VIGAN_01339200 [Vigna angularis var. angularis]|uniref:THH1/TOM1/TOM3 domain-containing protein n=1 Tax=Vigna angularis var. angularis TaxID=157739 RepID=A0A0S3R4W3_PHAAN|nr:hypothetical protein VIGAN_01339200 [Vigna angularis var. angularis]
MMNLILLLILNAGYVIIFQLCSADGMDGVWSVEFFKVLFQTQSSLIIFLSLLPVLVGDFIYVSYFYVSEEEIG